jgi:hypothetical protein
MVHAIGGDELMRYGEVALVENLLDHAAGTDFQVFG